MVLIESIIKFISSYPMWAKGVVLVNVVFICATLVFAPRMEQKADASSTAKNTKEYQLTIDGVELFPQSDSAAIKVTAFVNGTKFTYPSIGGVEWLQVAPSMAGQTFHLPTADRYEIRFEMLKREEGTTKEAKLLSQETILFSHGSTEGRYRLHDFDAASMTRRGGISAEIIYSIKPAN